MCDIDSWCNTLKMSWKYNFAQVTQWSKVRKQTLFKVLFIYLFFFNEILFYLCTVSAKEVWIQLSFFFLLLFFDYSFPLLQQASTASKVQRHHRLLILLHIQFFKNVQDSFPPLALCSQKCWGRRVGGGRAWVWSPPPFVCLLCSCCRRINRKQD